MNTSELILNRTYFAWGYFDASGEEHIYIPDYQGNIRQVIDADGFVEQQTDYYPYGLPMATSNTLGAEKNPFKHGNSRDARSLRPLQMAPLCPNSTASPTPDARAVRPYRHRTHLPALCLFTSPDPKAHRAPDVSYLL